MRRNAQFILFLSCLLTVVLIGCGGKSLNGLKSAGSKTNGKGKATVHLTWPKRSKSSSRLIPQAANSVKVVLLQSGTPVASTVLTRPAIADPTTSAYDFTELVPGTYSAVATAYPSTDATSGVAQAKVTSPLTIIADQSTPLTLTMDSAISTIQVAAAGGATSLSPASTLQITATPRDATGAVILTTSANMTWDTNDHSKATIDANGLVTSIAAGSVIVTALDTEHQKSGTLNLTISDPNGLYIMQGGSVAHIPPSGSWQSYGTLGSGTGRFRGDFGIVVDSLGRIYVGDYFNNRIIRMNDMNGSGWTTFGSLGSGTNQFHGLDGIVLDSQGRIYIADSLNSRIVRIDDMNGTNWTTFGTHGSGTNQLNSNQGVWVDNQNRIYISDQGNNRIVRMDDMSGTNWTTFGTSGSGTNQFNTPQGITVDSQGRIYVVDLNNHHVVRINDMSGTNWTTFGTSGSGTNQFNGPEGIALDSQGHIYIGDGGNSRIVRIDDMSGSGWTTFTINGSVSLGGSYGVCIKE